MRSSCIAAFAILLIVDASVPGRAQTRTRLNGVINLIEQKQPVFGVYWPANGGGRRGGEPPPARPAADLAKDALGYTATDFLFSGGMEGGVDRGLPAYMEFVKALLDVSGPGKTPFFGSSIRWWSSRRKLPRIRSRPSTTSAVN
jgi:hypothetical protein